MKDWVNNLLWVIVFLTLLNGSVFIMQTVIVERTKAELIEYFEKEHSPSPYGPGFDPDRFDFSHE